MKIAIMYNPHSDFPTVGGYLQSAFERVCQVDQYTAGAETEGYDHYFYVDDSPTWYMEPKHRPASFWAIDLVLPHLDFLQTPEQYLERCRNFDYVYVTSTTALEYCRSNGVEAEFLGFAADLEYHKPHPEERSLDWVAAWHNCGNRIEATDRAASLYPSGRVLFACWHEYARYISMGKCVLNILRGNLVNMRVFEAMAIGTPLITSRHLDMDRYGFVEGRHYLGHDSLDELLDQIGRVRDNPDNAAAMAERAREYVLSRHTYNDRVKELAWLQR